MSNSLCHSWNDKPIPLQILYPSSVSWKKTPLYFFSSNNVYFAQKKPFKIKLFETFKCSGKNSSNSPCQLWNDKSVPLQIFLNSSLSWQITPLWILSSYFFQVWIKASHQNPNFVCSEKICHIPHVIFQTTSQLKVMLDKSINNALGEGM